MRVFLAGATGATGRVFAPLAEKRGHPLVLHVRPATAARHPLGQDPRAAVFDLADESALRRAIRGCDVIVSLVGTMKKRFATGDTYDTSDVGTTSQLVEAAKAERVSRLRLLSSYGAGGPGAYAQMKGECERIVMAAQDIRWTIFRPSALVSPEWDTSDHHGRREVPGAVQWLGNSLRHLPLLQGFADDIRAIPIEVVARAIVSTLEHPRDREILSGRDIWRLGEA
ncbi:MAG: NAD(P)H-binding protein [Deltaproteobacteria bacterium]|nr:NAD(P)H-binding protein [Deltaproteobacteria bacterium]